MWIKPNVSKELASFVYFLHPFFFFFFSPQNKFESRKTPIAGFTAELYLGHVEHFNSELLSTASYLVPQDLVMSP